MKLLSVPLARTVWIFDIAEVNPRGKNVFVDLVPALVSAYRFTRFPKQGDDLKEGMKFGAGTFENSTGDDVQVGLTIYDDGFVADAFSSTRDTDEFLGHAVKLLPEHGYAFDPSMVRKRKYLSQVVVRCSGQLASLNPKLGAFAKRIADVGGGEAFRCAAIEFWPDQSRVDKPANFSFQKRAGDNYGDDRYWSQASLPTEAHIELLGELEAILS
jgi:hypothetical protein